MENHFQIRFLKAALFTAAVTIIFTCMQPIAWCQCSPMQILEFAKAGYTQAQINEVCGGSASDEAPAVYPQYQVGHRCSTYYGWCPMDAPAPIGAACACYTVEGAIEGMVVE